MIALPLPFRLPSLQVGGHKIPEYTPKWLEASIHSAAAEAGHEKWWLAEDIAKSVFLYLRDRFQGNIITLAEVFSKTSVALEAVGFVEIADKLDLQAPPAHICLPGLVREAGATYELGFFHLLSEKIGDFQSAGTPTISLTGLNACALQLRGTEVWDTSCEQVKSEIIDFSSNTLQANATHSDRSAPTLLIS